MNFIGITTYKRPDLLKFTLKQISELKGECDHVFVYDDGTPENQSNINIVEGYGFEYCYGKNKGIAYSKNQCIKIAKELKANNVILFDDDTFPIKIGFFDYLIETANQTNNNHFILQIKEKSVCEVKNLITTYHNSQGMMLFITKKVLDSNIKFDESFGKYGFEHVKFSIQIAKKGLNEHPNIEPNRLQEYISSFHISDHKDYLKDNNIEFKCSLTTAERFNAVEYSKKKWFEFINSNRYK